MSPAPFTPLEKVSSVRTRLKEVNQSFERNLKPFANFLTGFIVFYTYLLKSKRKSLVNPAPSLHAVGDLERRRSGVNYKKGAG